MRGGCRAKAALSCRSGVWQIVAGMRWLLLTTIVAVACMGCSDDETSASSTGDGGMGAAVGAGGMGGDGAAGGMGGAGGSPACVDSLPPDEELPDLLSETGLYTDIAAKTVAAEVRLFEPRFVLWSDDADKARWVYLPECSTIDTSDMNDWSFPVGTRWWKEFSVGGERIETRLIERIGEGPQDFEYTSYLWNDDETEATREPDGVVDAKGTTHDVPAEPLCRQCHGSHAKGGGRPSRGLGVSAVQLADAAELSLADLVADGKLSDPPASTSFTVPGASDQVRDALGYLHANCGNCHNTTSDRVVQIDMNLWLDFEVTDVQQTGAYATAVGVANTLFNDQNVSARVEPGDAQASALWFRMSQRGNNAQMPPVGSEVADATGLGIVETWIGGLP